MKKEISEFEQKANEFLAAHNIEFEAKFISTRKYFNDDTGKRDVYKIIFSRWTGGLPSKNEQIYLELDFGQSINNSGLKYGQKTRLHSPVKNVRIKPNAYDVLACITKSDPSNFEDFCSEFGYNEDSRKDYKLWESVCEEWKKVSIFFKPEELEQLQDIN